jgi:hypothetical protein
MDGEVAVETQKGTDTSQVTTTSVKAGEVSKVETTYENEVPVPLVEKPSEITRKMEGAIERSFYTSTKVTDPWAFTDTSTSLLRLEAGLEYITWSLPEGTTPLGPTSSSNFGIYYMPTFLILSSIHIEPYFGTSFSAPKSSIFKIRAGGRLNFLFYKGAYAGGGFEIMWLNTNAGKFAPGFSIDAGYTFLNKIFGFIDGVKFTYTYNRFKLEPYTINASSLLFGIVANFSVGRETW